MKLPTVWVEQKRVELDSHVGDVRNRLMEEERKGREFTMGRQIMIHGCEAQPAGVVPA